MHVQPVTVAIDPDQAAGLRALGDAVPGQVDLHRLQQSRLPSAPRLHVLPLDPIRLLLEAGLW